MHDRNVARKRRPVDVLFGDRSAAYPDYVIESPQPVTTVSPPPPILTLIVEPEPAPAPLVAPVEKPPPALVPVAPLLPVFAEKPISVPEPVLVPSTVATQDRISKLYDDVRMQLSDTPRVTRECMELLLAARLAFTEGDLATAEFYAESVDVRLTQCALSQQASRRPVVWIISLWNLVMLVSAGALLVATYVSTLTLFGVTLGPEVLLMLRTVAWGIIGAVLGLTLTLVRAIRRREYDPANELGYFAKAVVGAEFGAVFFILFQGIVILGNLAAGVVQLIHVFMYLLAMLVAFGQDMIIEFFSSVRQ